MQSDDLDPARGILLALALSVVLLFTLWAVAAAFLGANLISFWSL